MLGAACTAGLYCAGDERMVANDAANPFLIVDGVVRGGVENRPLPCTEWLSGELAGDGAGEVAGEAVGVGYGV